jgi:hypothetical protein
MFTRSVGFRNLTFGLPGPTTDPNHHVDAHDRVDRVSGPQQPIEHDVAPRPGR